MSYVIFLGVSILLFIGYFGFTVVEARTGARVLNGMRSKIDARIERIEFILGNVDWVGFFKHMVASAFARIMHDIVHFSLIAVRFLERQLTRLMRVLRNRRPNVLAPKPSRRSPLTQTVAHVRELLHSSKDRE